MHRSVIACGAAGLVLGSASICLAEVHSDVHAAYTPGGAVVHLTTTWGDRSGAELAVGKAKPVELHAGAVAGALAAGHGRVVVALAVDDADAPFRIIVVDRDKRAAPVAIARPAQRHDLPFAVAVAPTPNGFAVFFQEVEAADPTAAHTYLVELDDTGAPGAATEIAVPWSLAAAAWNGDGYHLALIYVGGDGMRLSMVSVTTEGQPQQHPDWASRSGFVNDVHLVAQGGKIRAFYRGGAGGDRLMEADVTRVREWGTEPPRAKDRGALPTTMVIAIADSGRPTKVRSR